MLSLFWHSSPAFSQASINWSKYKNFVDLWVGCESSCNNNSINIKHDLKVQQSWCGRVQSVQLLIKLELINYNKTNIRIWRIFYNLCGLKEHLSDFLKASMSQIDLIRFSRAFHWIIDWITELRAKKGIVFTKMPKKYTFWIGHQSKQF